MPDNSRDLLRLIFMGLVFAFVLAVWLSGVIMWARRRARRTKQLGTRLGLERGTEQRVLRLWKDGREKTTTVTAHRRLGLMDRIQRACRQAGLNMTVPSFLLATAGICLTMFLGTLLLSHNVLLALGAMALALLFQRIWLQGRASRRDVLFEAQLIEALELASRSLRAGHPLIGSFHVVSEEVADPVGAVFRELCQQQTMGVPLHEALGQASVRAGSADLALFAASVNIQTRSGGNLADMMDRLAAVIRDRRRLSGRVRVLSAQTQFSKRILLAMPVTLFFALNLINPRYMEPLYTSAAGKMMIVAAAIGMLLGTVVMNRLAKLRY